MTAKSLSLLWGRLHELGNFKFPREISLSGAGNFLVGLHDTGFLFFEGNFPGNLVKKIPQRRGRVALVLGELFRGNSRFKQS